MTETRARPDRLIDPERIEMSVGEEGWWPAVFSLSLSPSIRQSSGHAWRVRDTDRTGERDETA